MIYRGLINKHKLTISVLLIITLLSSILSFASCSDKIKSKYDDDFVIGNSIDAIIEEYGKFNVIFHFEDGITIQRAGYVIKKGKTGFFGTDVDTYYMIMFNTDGIATETWQEEGGWGG